MIYGNQILRDLQILRQVGRRQEHRGEGADPGLAPPLQGRHRGADVRPRRGQLGRQGD